MKTILVRMGVYTDDKGEEVRLAKLLPREKAIAILRETPEGTSKAAMMEKYGIMEEELR